MECLIFLYFHVMYVCFHITLCLFSETKADGLANDSNVQMDAVADGFASCM